MLFDNVDQITANSLKLRIELLINKFEPRVRSQQVDVVPLYDENAFEITMYFYVIGVPDPVTFSTILRRSR
jgi:predicted component of type VI protein secretion system